MRRRLVLALLTALAVGPTRAAAEPTVVIDGSRIRLADVVSSAPAELRDLDLGPAPPPGGSRLLSRSELRRLLRGAGAEAQRLELPRVVRVVGASRRLEPNELAKLVGPAVRRRLQRGVSLVAVKPRSAVRLSPQARLGTVTVSRPPKRVGMHKSTALVEFVRHGAVAKRLVVPVVLRVDQEGARYDLARGARANLLIEHGAVRISAAAIALSAADIGDIARFRVIKTRKLLKARVESRTLARVVGNQQ